MIDPTSPTRDIKNRLLLFLHQDGLLDLLAGAIVATFGLVPILDETGMNPGLRQVIILSIYGASVATILILKRKVSLPRSGYVKLARRTTVKMSLIMLIVNILLFLCFLSAYLFDIPFRDYLGNYQMSVPLGLIFLIMFTVAGGMLNATRFHFYGLFVLATFMGGDYLYSRSILPQHGLPVAAFVSGGIIMLAGAFQLRRFLKVYRKEYQ